VIGAGRERGKRDVVTPQPGGKFRMRGADQRQVKEAAHGGADGGGVVGVRTLADEDDRGDAGSLCGAEDGAQVAGAADVLDHQVAQAWQGGSEG